MQMTPYIPEIRFADIDAMGHVNNAVYFTYFEQARIHTFRQMVGFTWDWKTGGILVARNEIDYKLPVLLQDHIEIYVRCTRIGEKSFTLTYELMRGDVLCASGASVLVCYNHKEQRTKPVPEQWRVSLDEIIK